MSLSQGQLLNNRYRIDVLIKEGGFGAIYKAWDYNLNQHVALKENRQFSQGATSQFAREAQLMAQLTHTNLPRVYDHFTVLNQGQYLVMEFVEGWDLQQVLDHRGALPEQHALDFIQQVASALSYLHSQTPPVIHRDVKPANIKVTQQGRAVLVDFGIAKAYSADKRTTHGARAVTPGYSPPEQYGHGNTDARTDVYALGATLYALLTRQDPPESVQRQIGQSSIRLPQNCQPHVTQTIMKAMALDPNHRWPTAEQFARALQQPAEVRSTPTSRVTAPAAPAKNIRWPALLGVGAVAILLLLGGFVARPFFSSRTSLAELPTVESASTIVIYGENGEAETAPPTPVQDHGGTGLEDIPAAETPSPIVVTEIVILEVTPTPLPTLTPSKTPLPAPTPLYREWEIGESIEGRPIHLHQFGSGNTGSSVLVIGALHPGFSPTGVRLADRLIEHYKTADLAEELGGVTLYVLPDPSPDTPLDPGEKPGRLNANGVDMNRNWGCNWRSRSSYENGKPVSGGSAAFSEPEVRALRDFILEVQPQAVIVYGARSTDGDIYYSLCHGEDGDSHALSSLYSEGTGYSINGNVQMGDGEIGDWLASQGIPAIFVLLPDYSFLSNSDWDTNHAGVRRVISSIK